MSPAVPTTTWRELLALCDEYDFRTPEAIAAALLKDPRAITAVLCFPSFQQDYLTDIAAQERWLIACIAARSHQAPADLRCAMWEILEREAVAAFIHATCERTRVERHQNKALNFMLDRLGLPA